MAGNIKTITADTQAGLTLQCSARRQADGFYMDDVDGDFKAMPVADVWAAMTEDANFLGRYERLENRQSWIDGYYLLAIRNAASAAIIGSRQVYILSDEIVEPQDVLVTNRSYLESIGIMLSTLTSFAAFGNKWFVAKDWGDDNNPGTFSRPFKTIWRAVQVSSDGTHDTIMVYPASSPYAEQLLLDKTYLSLIGSGHGCVIDPGIGATDITIRTAAPGVCISGFETVMGRGYAAIYAQTGSDFLTVERGIYRNDGTGVNGHGIILGDAIRDCLIQDCSVSHSAQHGIYQLTPNTSHYNRFLRVSAHQNGRDGIHIEGDGCDCAVINACEITNNGLGGVEGHGVHIGGMRNIVWGNVIKGNAFGTIHDVGVDNIAEYNGDDADIMEADVTTAGFRRIVLAALAGDVADAQTASPKFKSMDGLKTRITALVDNFGNRTGSARNGSL